MSKIYEIISDEVNKNTALYYIKEALRDGETLARLGFSDEDQDPIDEAYGDCVAILEAQTMLQIFSAYEKSVNKELFKLLYGLSVQENSNSDYSAEDCEEVGGFTFQEEVA